MDKQPQFTTVPAAPPLERSDKASVLAWHERWQRDRALQSDWYVKATTGFFSSAPFTLISHALDGKQLLHESCSVHDPKNANTPRNDKGEPRKYDAPFGSGTVIYAPLPDSRTKFRDAKVKYIAEGHGKTIALVGLGLPVLGIAGINNWHVRDSDELHPDLSALIRPGDEIVIVPDGDFHTNPGVATGLRGLLGAISGAGATPRTADLHEQANQKIDDLIVYWRGQQRDPMEEFLRLPTLTELPSQPLASLTSQAELLDRPPPVWIVKGLIPPGELTAIVGEPSCGKTFLTMDLLLAVARKERYFHGHLIKRHGLVVHITLEGTSLGARHQAYMKHHGLAASLPYLALEQPINLRDDPAWLITAIQREAEKQSQPVVLIAVDTVNRAMGGGDENSSVDMGAFLASAEKLKSAFPGAGVLLVHHLGKNSDRGARGHSSFTGNIGAELAVSMDDATKLRTVRVTKQRDASTDAAFNFTLQVVELGKDEDGDAITSCVVVPTVAQSALQNVRNSTREVHRWIHDYWRQEHGMQHVAKTRLDDEWKRIVPPKAKMLKAEFMSAVSAILSNPEYAEPAPASQQPRAGTVYILKPPKVEKF